MNIKLFLYRNNVTEFQYAFNILVSLSVDKIDYIEYYNLNNISAKIRKIVERWNFTNAKKFTLSITPNEARDLLKIVRYNATYFADTPYFTVLIIDLVKIIDKHFLDLEHRKNIAIQNYKPINLKK